MTLRLKVSLLPCALTLLLLVSAGQAAPVWAQSARDREEKSQNKSSSGSSSDRGSSGSSSQPARDREERAQDRSSRRDNDRDRPIIIYNDPYYDYGYGYGGGNAAYFRGRRNAPRIAFVSDRDGFADLYIMRENGALLDRLTRTAAMERRPVFSPRKGRLAFMQGEGQIVLMNADGAKRMTINVSSLAPVRDPVWMADDKRIAFVSERDGNAEIYTIDANGRNLRRMTNHPAADTQPTFRATGGRMVFVSTRDGKAALYTMSTEGIGEVQRITAENLPPVSDPAYAPDGRSVVFVAGEGGTSDLYLLDMESGRLVKLVTNMKQIRNPAFNPEGNRIVFSSNQPGYFALFTISRFSTSASGVPDPKDVNQLTYGPGNDTEPTWW